MNNDLSAKPSVVYHLLRQAVFEQSLIFMQGVLGKKGTLIDLGAGHCAFSRMAHAMGWKATALDVRKERVPDLPGEIGFIHGDINSMVWNPADYDVILCLGVYYHLDQNMQHRLLERCKGKPIIIDTHIANPPGMPTRYGRMLGETYEKNGEWGADYKEAPHLDDKARKETGLLASYDNPTSWWQTKDSLLQTLHQYGWPHVWTFDYDGLDFVQRTFFVCNTVDQSGTGLSGIRI
ncbi:hypothetical protein L598_001200000090 [Mesorhizobium sp. J18]|uniref:class I SAM-dependent methyltransferase n=1 Tax=Mesorhizobium sp. J18 TaxID=935263 RepID=UPI00119C6090|nr:class I SAM-dependent methyltransferase [Mesorhizobium sp. J18]TWG99877.1 hypothetical protein L598_001200000090 [Mesorhizobium sp. J18]